MESGRQQIDAAVAGMLDALGNQTTVIEGYSSLSAPDEQYVSSQRRADLVREYIEERYHLRHDSIGVVPLRAQPPQSADRDKWDGAAIVLLAQKAH